MDTVMMKMSSYNIENEAIMLEEYGEELMYAGWNPQVALASQQPMALLDKHINLLASLVNVDVDAFLQKMYKNQR